MPSPTDRAWARLEAVSERWGALAEEAPGAVLLRLGDAADEWEDALRIVEARLESIDKGAKGPQKRRIRGA